MLSLLSCIPKGNIAEHTALVKLLMLWKARHLSKKQFCTKWYCAIYEFILI